MKDEDVPEDLEGLFMAIEVKGLRTHILDELRLAGRENRVDSDKWNPMIMSFQNLDGLKDGKLAPSKLANIEEEAYCLPV
jgi:hypothetical protein